MPPHFFRNISIVADFQKGVDKVVREYLDRLLEEVTESQSKILMKADSDIMHREKSLKYVCVYVSVCLCVCLSARVTMNFIFLSCCALSLTLYHKPLSPFYLISCFPSIIPIFSPLSSDVSISHLILPIPLSHRNSCPHFLSHFSSILPHSLQLLFPLFSSSSLA